MRQETLLLSWSARFEGDQSKAWLKCTARQLHSPIRTSYVQEAVQASVRIHKQKQKLGSHPVATDIHENGNGSLQNTFVSSPFFNMIILYQGTPIGNLLGQGACIALATLANEACQGESVELSGIGALLINLLLKFQAPQRGIPGITSSIHCKHNAQCTAYTTYCTETRSIV